MIGNTTMISFGCIVYYTIQYSFVFCCHLVSLFASLVETIPYNVILCCSILAMLYYWLFDTIT